jgi:hypothetical protein
MFYVKIGQNLDSDIWFLGSLERAVFYHFRFSYEHDGEAPVKRLMPLGDCPLSAVLLGTGGLRD